MIRRKFEYIFLYIALILVVVSLASCAVDPLYQNNGNDSVLFVTPDPVSVSLTKDRKDSVTVTIVDDQDLSEYRMYYNLHLRTADSDECKTYLLNRDRTYTIDGLAPGTKVIAEVEKVIEYNKKRGGVHREVSVSMPAEGSTLPCPDFSVTLYEAEAEVVWTDNAFRSYLNPSEFIYDGLSFTLKRDGVAVDTPSSENHRYIYKDMLSGQTEVTYTLSWESDTLAGLEKELVVPVKYTAPLPAQSLTVTGGSGAVKDMVKVGWVLSKPDGSDNKHRVKLERSVAGSDKWIVILDKETDIESELFHYEKEGNLSRFIYEDRDVEFDTSYCYRITTYYAAGDVYIPSACYEPVVSGEGNRLSLPVFVSLEPEMKDEDKIECSAVYSVEWSPVPLEGVSFAFIRTTDGSGEEVRLPAVPEAEARFSDTVSMGTGAGQIDSRVSHIFSYTPVLIYPDGSEYRASETLDFEYTPAFSVPRFSNLQGSQDMARSGEISFTEDFNSGFDSSWITYSLYRGDSCVSSEPRIADGVVTFSVDGLEDGTNYIYTVKGVCSPQAGVLGGAEYVMDVEVDTLPAPSALNITSVSEENVTLEVEAVPGCAGYRFFYGPGEEEFVESTNEMCSFTSQTLDASQKYEISVAAFDSNHNLTGLSEPVSCSFVHLVPEVSARDAESFTVKWNRVESAESYRVELYLDGHKLDESVVDGCEKRFSADDPCFAPCEQNPVPISEKYRVKITPLSSSIEMEGSASVEGSWLTPPEKVTASKAADPKMVRVAWTPVADADSYVLYRSDDGKTGWSELYRGNQLKQTVPSDREQYYTVSSVYGGKESRKQQYFSEEMNLGYPLFKVKEFLVDRLKAGYQLILKPVKDARFYMVKIGDSVRKILPEEMQLKNGYLTCFCPSESIDDDTFEIASGNCEDETEVASEYSDGVPVEKLVMEHLLTALHTHLHAADKQFEGDWWPGSIGSGAQKTYRASGITITTVRSTTWSSSQEHAGHIVMNNLDLGDGFTARTASSDAFAIQARDGGGAGYLGTDPLETIGSGTYIVSGSLSGEPEEIRVECSGWNVQNKTGTVVVHLPNGVDKSFSYDAFPVRPF